MTDDLFEQPDNATPLRPEEARALRMPVVDRRQLNEIEATNVAIGRDWAMRSRKPCFSSEYLCELHKRMFGKVWKWAGEFRDFEVNIGATPPYQIATEVRTILDDAKFWYENETYAPVELAIRLHHRLVLVHPFVNGNGRCTRLMADVVIKRLKAPALTWGSSSLIETGEARAAYIAALKDADEYDIDPLVSFAQS